MRTNPALSVALAALLLSGCTAHGPVHMPTPSPSPTPVFASDEEALAAAEAAYREYLRVSDEIAQDGGANPERIAEVVTDDRLPSELDALAKFPARKVHSVGNSIFGTASLQQYSDIGGTVLIDIYTCLDVSGVRLISESGTDVTPERQDKLSLVIGLESAPASPGRLLVSDSDVWDGVSFCE